MVSQDLEAIEATSSSPVRANAPRAAAAHGSRTAAAAAASAPCVGRMRCRSLLGFWRGPVQAEVLKEKVCRNGISACESRFCLPRTHCPARPEVGSARGAGPCWSRKKPRGRIIRALFFIFPTAHFHSFRPLTVPDALL